MNKAVIFDMDGVIIDSESLWKQAEFEVFSSLGVTITEEYSRQTKTMTTNEVAKFWYDKNPWETISLEAAEQMVVMRVIKLIQTHSCQIVGIKPFIEKLKACNYKIGLATNSPLQIIPVVLNKLNVFHLFDAISSAELEIKGKPDPAIYLNTAEKLEVTPDGCIVIEDSYSGMLAAKNAGMVVVAFTNGNCDIEFDIADYKITSFEDHGLDVFK
ncbi:MAG: hexitol phosphatase HxpB [Bacteroidales bacterium]|nr:hexitol phosphatase HxpB [Bacteroidales bacterium]